MTHLLLATRNAHKVAEIRSILGDKCRFLTLHDFPTAPALNEDARTFAGNATQKAEELARWFSATQATGRYAGSLFTLADDSGLEVDALNGAPGVHSARFAALDTGKPGNSPDAENSDKLLHLLKDVPLAERTARFRCVLALTPVAPEPGSEFEQATELFEGVCEGRIAFVPCGKGGFGYDPLFIPEGREETFAELGEELKNQISHRAKALAKLRQRLAG